MIHPIHSGQPQRLQGSISPLQETREIIANGRLVGPDKFAQNGTIASIFGRDTCYKAWVSGVDDVFAAVSGTVANDPFIMSQQQLDTVCGIRTHGGLAGEPFADKGRVVHAKGSCHRGLPLRPKKGLASLRELFGCHLSNLNHFNVCTVPRLIEGTITGQAIQDVLGAIFCIGGIVKHIKVAIGASFRPVKSVAFVDGANLNGGDNTESKLGHCLNPLIRGRAIPLPYVT